MNFTPTEDRRMLADSLNRFFENEYDFATRERILQSEGGFSRQHWQQLADMGVIGALFAEADGGYGGAGFDLAVVFEALGRGLAVEPFLGTLMAGSAIAAAGKTDLLGEIVAGSHIVAWVHVESEAGYEISHVATTAKQTVDGWQLDGAKAVVQHGGTADAFVVSARVAGQLDDAEGIALFLVPADVRGLTLRDYPNIDGGRAAELTLAGVCLPAPALLCEAEVGYATIETCVGRGIVALCAEAVGAMEVAKAATLEYLQTRKQFGVAIGSFQALQHRMADMALEIEQARSALINAAAVLEHTGPAREKALSAAKYTMGRVGALVAEECIQLHGGIGMTWELPLSHYAKRLIMIDHQLGDEDYHLVRYMAL
ncbi:MAG TPA: acyl-CoA dehydrogenase [Burkholderiaceae bacterium]|jgi:hypothetical protein